MSSNKKGLIMRTLLTSNYGGCGCGKPKPSQVHQPTPIPKISLNYHNTTTTHLNPTTTTTTTSHTSSSTSTGAHNDDDDDDLLTSTTVSSETETTTTTTHHQDHSKKSFLLKPNPKIVDDSVAVEKESKDPYRDFRYSMLQMIFEKEIFSESGLQELLQCFLELNAPCHHHVIVQVFMEICQETFPKKSCNRDDDRDDDSEDDEGGGGSGESSSCRSELARGE